jgi:probable rRNA maturation factor
MIKIDVFLKDKNWKKYISNPSKYLRSKVRYIDSSFSFFKNKNINFSILLAGNKEVRALNKKFRKKDKTTDVLSFPFYKNIMERDWRMDVNFRYDRLKKNHPAFNKKESKHVYLGDIILNFYKINKKNFKRDFNRLWIHGFLHLLGHKHYKDKDYYKMNRIEKLILKKIEDKQC